MLKKLSEKLGAKFPATTPSCSMVKLAISMILPEIFFNPKQAREMANHSSKKKKTEDKKERGKKIQLHGPKCLKRDSGGKNG